MIESCTKKRMLLGITLLGGLTILVLIVESQWTESASSKTFTPIQEHNATRISTEIDTSSCQSCIGLEHSNKSMIACVQSKCNKVAVLQEKAFVKFESLMFAGALLSCATVFWRENILRRRIIRKVARQLRASV